MADQKGFCDEIYSETMSLMAENFFTRRKEMDARLENFARLSEEVRDIGLRALRRWRTFLLLLADDEGALRVLERAGMDAPGLRGQASAQDPLRLKIPFAMTRSGRHRKVVRLAYQEARQATLDYLEGAYATDPKNPVRKILTPNYAGLKELAAKINEEVAVLNCCQSPSCMLAYVKSLDPALQDMEAHAGGFTGENVCRIDQEMALKPLDFEGLGLPMLAAPAPLEDIQPALDSASGAVFTARQAEALSAMARVAYE